VSGVPATTAAVAVAPVHEGTVVDVTDEQATLNALGLTERLPAGTKPRLRLVDDAPEATVNVNELDAAPERFNLTH